jgi:SAM-dependent methyltransferase
MNPFENWNCWAKTPLGIKLLSEEQAWLDTTLQDVFGYHALQVGPEPLDALRLSRMSSRVRVIWPAANLHNDQENNPSASMLVPTPHYSVNPDQQTPSDPNLCQGIYCAIDELPFQAQSLDLLVLAHALEVTTDPHQLLREADRVLIPEGKLVITGFNPMGLWAYRRRCRSVNQFPPAGHHWIGLPRLKDWLTLLNFDIGAGSASAYGAYVPPFDSEKWLEYFHWMNPAGRRWWPMAGGVYFLMAIKRVQGMRVISPAWKDTAKSRRRAVAASPVKAKTGIEQ